MSASPIARQATQSQSIPSRHVVINDASQLPMDYSTTPGGTLFSTTPGGTRIVYDRSFLLQLRNSPAAQTPPKNLPMIPGITTDALPVAAPKPTGNGNVVISNISLAKKDGATGDDVSEQFQLEI